MILVFDLIGVLFSNGLNIAVEQISKKYSIGKEEVEYVIHEGEFATQYRKGLTNDKTFWKNVEARWKLKNSGELKKIYFDAYVINEEMVQFVKSLKSFGYRIGFLSNGPKDRTKYLDKKYEFIGLFDFGIFSFEAHSKKPEKEIYAKFLKKFRLKPEQIIYIDDKEKNLSPAKKLGMKTILFKNLKQLKNELKKMEIVIQN